jgi:L-threonylcarbamoyladenylate synthase
LTLLLNKAPQVSDVVTGGKQTIGLRLPAHPLLLQILQQSGLAVAAPSANPYKKLSPTSAEQVVAGLNGKIAAVLDGGDCQVGLESTIVDLTGEHIQVLRAGPISAAELEAVLGVPVTTPQSHNVAVPGNVKAHYQPGKPLQMLSRMQLLQQLPGADDVILLCHSDDVANSYRGTTLRLSTEKTAYARALYRTLFQADSLAGSRIWLEQPPQEPAWADVNDRLARACHQ